MYGAIFVIVSALVAFEVNRTLPQAFIDEIFHIPQTQRYCNGSFIEWDPKITTPPGLYVFALLLNLPLKLLSVGYFCSIAMLRACNIAFNAVSMLLLQKIILQIHGAGKDGPSKNLYKLQGFTIAFFPLNYFFSFLYYTDPGSTMFVLAAYLANLKSQHKLSAFLGLLSVFFRQTNIVWVLFLAGNVVVKEMVKAENIKNIETSPEIEDKLARFLVSIVAAAVRYLLIVRNIIHIIKQTWPYLAVLGMFAGFLHANGGIVLGDKQNHVAVFHGVQILYFFVFTMVFSAPHFISAAFVRKFVNALGRNPTKFMVLSIIFAYLIIKHTMIHKFLLADNRHYTFYLCRYFLNHWTFRIGALPLYIYAGWAGNEVLTKPKCSGIWKLLILLCTMLVTLPQRLLELRYFIVPYILFRVNIPVRGKEYVVLEMFLYMCINFVTLFIFFTKPVIWPDLDMPQRIIW